MVNDLWFRLMKVGYDIEECHINFYSLVRINSNQVVRDMSKITKLINVVCKECQIGKKPRKSFKVKEQSTTSPLELVDTYLCGTTRIRKFQGDRWVSAPSCDTKIALKMPLFFWNWSKVCCSRENEDSYTPNLKMQQEQEYKCSKSNFSTTIFFSK